MTSNNRSVLRALSILKAFHSKAEWVSVSEISRRAALPFASTHRLLQALGETGAVERGDGGAYRLGFLIASVAQSVNVDDCLFRASRDLMTGLSQKLNVSMSLGRLEGNMVVVIGRILNPNAKRNAPTGGGQSAAYNLALGRVLLADLSEQDLNEILKNHAFLPLTPHTITNKSKLAAELALVRKHGFAVEREEICLGLGCVGVPIHDHEGRVVASMSVSDEVQNLIPERIAVLCEEMMNIMPLIRQRILPESAADHGAVSGDVIPWNPARMREEMNSSPLAVSA